MRMWWSVQSIGHTDARQSLLRCWMAPSWCKTLMKDGHADLVEYAERWANAGKTVIVAALDGTFQRKPFNQILQLVPLAEEVGIMQPMPMPAFPAASHSHVSASIAVT